jgi:hypothetical protein
MTNRIKILIVLFSFLLSAPALAEPPKVELYLTQYSGRDCLDRARAALRASGFIVTSGTYQGEDSVGAQGQYKGVVSCFTEVSGAVVFVVAGPSYEEAKRLAIKLQANF